MRRLGWLVCVAGLVACGGGGGGQDGPVGDVGYVPHSDGFSWTYRLTRDGAAPAVLQVQIDGTEPINGGTAQRLRLTSEFGEGVTLGEINSSRVRLYRTTLSDNVVTFDPPMDLLIFPFELGDQFQASSRFSFGLLQVNVSLQSRVAGLETVQAGTSTYQDCFRLESKVVVSALAISIEAPVKLWLAKGAGVVRAETDLPENPFLPVSGKIFLEATKVGAS